MKHFRSLIITNIQRRSLDFDAKKNNAKLINISFEITSGWEFSNSREPSDEDDVDDSFIDEKIT